MINSIIPARSGSKGVPNKNIINLCGKPLMAYSIEISQKVKNVDHIYVTTDSEEYIEIAERYGVTGILRPDYCSSDFARDVDYLLHAIYTKNMKYDDIILLMRPTTPIRDVAIVNKAINDFMKLSSEYDSLRSMHEITEPPEKTYKILDSGEGIPYLDVDIATSNMPRQTFPKCYKPNGYVDLLRVSSILKNKTTYGNKVKAFITSDVTEIDSIEELEYIKYLMGKNNESI